MTTAFDADTIAVLAPLPRATKADMIPVWEHLRANPDKYRREGVNKFARGIAEELQLQVTVSFIKQIEKGGKIKVVGIREKKPKQPKPEKLVQTVTNEDLAALLQQFMAQQAAQQQQAA